MGARRTFTVPQRADTARLEVQVVDGTGQPLAGATVSVASPGPSADTAADGRVGLDVPAHGPLVVRATKAGHGTAVEGPERAATLTVQPEAGDTVQVRLTLHAVEQILTENILIVGSECYYNSFALKMMFIAPAFAMVTRGLELRPADTTTVVFVDNGYTAHEKLALEYLRSAHGVKLVPVTTAAAVLHHWGTRPRGARDGRPTRTLVQDLVIFCHGFPNSLALNLSGSIGAAVDLGPAELDALPADVFVAEGRIVSYACRTGVHQGGEAFANEAAAQPDLSLAQRMADHFGVPVDAFMTRTFYGDGLMAPGEFDALAQALDSQRATAAGAVVNLPPAHEALPHPGLGGMRAWWDGTEGYALWRKAGAVAMPKGHHTPSGLPTTRRRFNPCE